MIVYLKSVFSLGLLAAMLAGCVSVLPEPSAPDALYRIEATTTAPLGKDIIVKEPEAPRIFAGQHLVAEDVTGAIRLVPRTEWAGTATRQIQLALIDSFSVEGAGAATLPESGVLVPFEVSVRLKYFGLRADEAVCQAHVTIVDTSLRKIVANGPVEARAPAGSTDRPRAMKQAAETCVSLMAGFVSATLGD